MEMRARCLAMVTKANANGTATNLGIPQGWAGPRRRKMLIACRLKARAEAKEIVMEMKKTGVLLDGEDPRGDEAIEMACEIMRAKDTLNRVAYAYPVGSRLAAANLIAKFCKAPPATRITNKVEVAEDFLGALLASSRRTE